MVFLDYVSLVAVPLILGIGASALVVFLRRRGRALDQVTRGIQALLDRRPIRPVQVRLSGAPGRLAATFNSVAPRLEEHLSALEEDRRLLLAVLGGMAEGVIAIDARKRVLFANEAAAHLLGVGRQCEGRLLAELIRSPQVLEAADATLRSAGPHRVELQVAATEGRSASSPSIMAVQGTRLSGSPPSGAVLVFHDVTETRRLERVRQDFVANASHELKTPLTSIKAYTETLLEGALHDEGVNIKFLKCIEEQADRLNQLVQDLLSLARLESGEDTFQHTPLSLANVIRTNFETHRARAESSGLGYQLEIAPEAEDLLVRADEEAIRQVLDNLIDNALKYTGAGGRIRIRLRPAGRKALMIQVEDTGIGIPRQDLPRVFERFYRVDKARSRELGGTGLGLAIVKHLVQTLGGQIGVESRVGVGSTFTVRLPVARIDAMDSSRSE